MSKNSNRLSFDPLGAIAKYNSLQAHFLNPTFPANMSAPQAVETSRLDGKVALVTGSGRGIGAAMAVELARRGAKVVVNYANSLEAANKIVDQIKQNGGEAIAIKADVGDVSQTSKLMEEAKAHFGKLDIVCSNSGVVSFGHFGDVSEEEFDRVFRINTRGQFFVAREAYKHLEVGGRIILMGSITGQAKGVPKHAVYSGSKGAIETFVRCMAIDAGDKKITVNCIAPGGIKTDMYHAVCREYIPNGENLTDDQVDEVCIIPKADIQDPSLTLQSQYAATWSPLARVGQPIDIARVVCFLASQDGEWINGKVIGIDGAACKFFRPSPFSRFMLIYSTGM
jgi:tetrahydroxynaphthalene reductase